MTAPKRCDICDIRGGHDVHCVRFPYARPRVTYVWLTEVDRLRHESIRRGTKRQMRRLTEDVDTTIENDRDRSG